VNYAKETDMDPFAPELLPLWLLAGYALGRMFAVGCFVLYDLWETRKR
jgi:hypothetical protein